MTVCFTYRSFWSIYKFYAFIYAFSFSNYPYMSHRVCLFLLVILSALPPCFLHAMTTHFSMLLLRCMLLCHTYLRTIYLIIYHVNICFSFFLPLLKVNFYLLFRYIIWRHIIGTTNLHQSRTSPLRFNIDLRSIVYSNRHRKYIRDRVNQPLLAGFGLGGMLVGEKGHLFTGQGVI